MNIKILSGPVLAATKQLLGTIYDIKLLSHTNSVVCLVTTEAGRYVVKEIFDPTIDAFLEKEILHAISADEFFRPILYVQKIEMNRSCLVIAPYIEGTSLDSLTSSGQFSSKHARVWANDIHTILQLVQLVPVSGFGRPRLGKEFEYSTWTDFLERYLQQQCKKAPFLASIRFEHIWSTFNRLRLRLDKHTPLPKLINADVNARNFLVVPPNDHLRLIHMPVLWHGDPAASYGEAVIHFHDTAIAKELMSLCRFPAWRIHFYAAFSAYVILAYVERFGPYPLETALPWGGHRPLLDLLDEHLRELKEIGNVD